MTGMAGLDIWVKRGRHVLMGLDGGGWWTICDQ
jgi:hypothetical protein